MKKTNEKKKEPENIDPELMTEREMFSSLVSFYNSYAWFAYKKYINGRLALVDEALRCIDPFKNPTEMARNQGIRMGLNDLTEAMSLIIEQMSKKES